MQFFKFMSETLHIIGPLKIWMKYHWQSVLKSNNNRVNYSFLLENIDKLTNVKLSITYQLQRGKIASGAHFHMQAYVQGVNSS